jgi:hypothetical protein
VIEKSGDREYTILLSSNPTAEGGCATKGSAGMNLVSPLDLGMKGEGTAGIAEIAKSKPEHLPRRRGGTEKNKPEIAEVYAKLG